MNSKAVRKVKVEKAFGGSWHEADDLLVVEEPLEISLQYGPLASQVQLSISVTMRTPGNDRQLAAGFLFTEGIIRHPDEIKMIIADASGPNTVLVILKEDVKPLLPALRNFFTSSGCGVCGKASMEAIMTVSVFPKDNRELSLPGELFFELPGKLKLRQSVFESTGGIHAAGLFDLNGRLLNLCEDVGRHNALDKLIGAALLENILPLSSHILLLSGRASFELVQKAYMAGIRIIAAIGAPSSLSVDMAERHGISLVGFLREDRLNVYAGAKQIVKNIINETRKVKS